MGKVVLDTDTAALAPNEDVMETPEDMAAVTVTLHEVFLLKTRVLPWVRRPVDTAEEEAT